MSDHRPQAGAGRRSGSVPDGEGARAVARLESAVFAAGAELTAARRRAEVLEVSLEAARAEVRRLRSRLEAIEAAGPA